MDTILELHDQYLLTPYVYPSDWSEGSWTRQYISLFFIITLHGYVLYFITAGINYLLVFDKRLLQHPLILENQISKEIGVACRSVPFMGIPTALCFLLEVRGYSKLYHSVEEASWGWISVLCSIMTFILFTDCLIYWIHRGLHSRLLYKRLHKTHHLWKVSTPFASHAFHPVDGFLQSLPYHLYVFLFPMHKYASLVMFVLVNVWTVSIHDGDFRVPTILKPFVNGSAHHTDHHMYYNFNYGQFFTLWDKIGGSFREPSAFLGDSPMDQLIKKGIVVDKDKNKSG